MAGLLDIAPSTSVVDVRGTPVEVYGISAKGVAHLLGRFPELQTLLSGGELEVAKLFDMGGDIVAAIIAAGCGYPADTTAEEKASRLGLEDQASLLAMIIQQTMPSGVGPFVAKIEALGGVLGVAAQPANETKSLQPAPGSQLDTLNGQPTTVSPVTSQSPSNT
jgi:hypothetical protein